MERLLGNRAAFLGLSIAFILALGYVDYVTVFEFDLFLFYAVPVAITAWMVGRWAGVSVALVSVGVWFAAHLLWTNPYSSLFYAAWNTALHAGWMFLVALTIARIRDDLDRERRLNAALVEALNQVKVLQGLLPVCAWCRKIRNDEGYWEELETYIRKHTDAKFTHGICPTCQRRLLEEGKQQG
jgi:K+-sensing histidine kinase KdpD